MHRGFISLAPFAKGESVEGADASSMHRGFIQTKETAVVPQNQSSSKPDQSHTEHQN
jgi:hypothetical protein